jgi:aminoglycoside 3-N-acetyltransferase
MLKQLVARCLNDRQKRAVKSKINEAKQRFVRALRSYDAAKLKVRLRSLGITETDALLVHSNFEANSGFLGTPLDLVNALVDLVAEGNLLMVSIPFRGSAYDYLAQNKVFNVRKTMSMMGMVTELFRRRNGTVRSLHPTHPVLAFGKDASWLIADHELCRFACGRGSPFEKLRTLNGKILFFDVGFEAITFFHYVEDLLKDQLPFSVYDDRLFKVTVVDEKGQSEIVEMQAFSKALRRRADKLGAEMERQGKIRRGTIGNSSMLLVTVKDVVDSFTAMVETGNLPYELVTGGRNGRDRDNE